MHTKDILDKERDTISKKLQDIKSENATDERQIKQA